MAEKAKTSAELFTQLNALNVNDKTEQKQGLTYLSWSWAWAEFKKACPDATYEVIKFNGLPYAYDPNTGYMVYTTVTAAGITHEMWLPVMDGANKAMKAEPYEYETGYGQYKKVKRCEAATMFDVNKAIMRCLTKNLAMFGLGLYIYAGEDLPEDEAAEKPQTVYKPEPVPAPKKATKAQLTEIVKLVSNIQKLCDYYHIERIEDLTADQAAEVIARKAAKA